MGSMWGRTDLAPSPIHSTTATLLTSVLSFSFPQPSRVDTCSSLQLTSLASRDSLPLHNNAQVISKAHLWSRSHPCSRTFHDSLSQRKLTDKTCLASKTHPSSLSHPQPHISRGIYLWLLIHLLIFLANRTPMLLGHLAPSAHMLPWASPILALETCGREEE